VEYSWGMNEIHSLCTSFALHMNVFSFALLMDVFLFALLIIPFALLMDVFSYALLMDLVERLAAFALLTPLFHSLCSWMSFVRLNIVLR